MTVGSSWTNPTTLDKSTGQPLDQTTWEDALGNELWLYDLLTGTITTQEVQLNRALTGGPALAFAQGTASPPLSGSFGGGLRMSFWGTPGTDQAAFGIGIDSGTLWEVVPSSSAYKWYRGGTLAMQLDGSGLTVNGSAVTSRQITGGSAFNSNPNIAANGGTVTFTVNLDDTLSGTPSRVAVGLNTGGFQHHLVASARPNSASQVLVDVTNWSGSNWTSGLTVYVICY